MNRLIAFAGPMGCGKTTAAKHLGGTVLSFATPMKKCIKDLFDFSDDQLYTLEGKNAIDERYGVSPREVLQKFGTEFVRGVIPDLWVILMRKRIAETEGLVVIDDCRFENEAQMVRDLGGTVVHIRGRNLIPSDHLSECELWIGDEDLVVYNTGSLTYLLKRVGYLVGAEDL